MSDPLVPTASDVVWAAMTVVALVLSVAALISVIRTRLQSPVTSAIWALVILLLPVAGAVVWLMMHSRLQRGRGFERRAR